MRIGDACDHMRPVRNAGEKLAAYSDWFKGAQRHGKKEPSGSLTIAPTRLTDMSLVA